MSTRRMLVTGGAGFIGANFVYYWLARHPDARIVVLDSLTYAGCQATIAPLQDKPGFRFVEGDIRDQALVEKLLAEEHLDTLVHFAAESHVDRSITGPDAFIDTNIIGTHNLLKAARSIWLDGPNPVADHRFHHVSTDEVFGTLEADDPAFTETTPYAPNSPYSSSKAASDHLVRAYHHTYGLNVVTTNCSNNYGPYQFPEKLIPLCLHNMLSGVALPIYGDGLNIRDWLYVEDHCAGIALVMENGRLGETYNIGGNNEWTNIDIVRLMCSIVDEEFAQNAGLRKHYPNSPAAHGKRCEDLITYVTDRAGHDRRYAIDARKINGELGYVPAETFETGIRKTIRWYLDNEDWWRPLVKS